MSRAWVIVAVAAGVVAAGCATARLQSVVDTSRASRIDALSIVAGARDPGLAQDFAEILARKLTAIGVGSDSRILPARGDDALTLEQDGDGGAAARMVKDAPRAHVLTAQVTYLRGTATGFGSVYPDKIEMSFAIHARGDGRAVWKSRAQVSLSFGQAGLGSQTSLLTEISDKLVAQLRADGLLPAAPPSTAAPAAEPVANPL